VPVQGELDLFMQALEQLRAERDYAPQVLAVTGTNGKTTTTVLTALLVERAGRSAVAAGNISPTMLDTLMRVIDEDTLPQVWVLELSSFQLDGVLGFEPQAAALLNLTQDHLDWHGAMAAYGAAKARIFGARTRWSIATTRWSRRWQARRCRCRHRGPAPSRASRAYRSRCNAPPCASVSTRRHIPATTAW
jgi:UDP-N-acetylmuramoylalanine-D-glutamate ligase